MKYTTLGQTNLKISRICLGTMTWGVQNNQTEADAQLDYALGEGVNFIDTAEMYAIPPTPDTYGTTEEIIGNHFAQHNNRNEVVLATKFSPVPWARGEDNPTTNRKNIIEAVEGSLKRLQTDYIDLYQFHWPTNRPNYHFDNFWNFKTTGTPDEKEKITANKIEILETIQELIQAGKIKHFGLSDDSAWGIKHFCDLAEKHNLPRVASIQNEYHLMRRRDETDVHETCALEGVSYLTWSPLAMGVLSGKYKNGQRPAGERFSDEVIGEQKERWMTRLSKDALPVADEYVKIAHKHGIDPCQIAIAFTLRYPHLSASIIGATNLDQLKSNIAAVNLDLSKEILQDIQNLYEAHPIPF